MSGTNYTIGGSGRFTRLASPVRLRLAGLVLAVGVALILVVWIKSNAWRKLDQLGKEFAAIQTESFYWGGLLRGAITRMNGALLRFQMTADPLERDLFQQEARALKEIVERDIDLLATPREKALARRAQVAYREYLLQSEALLGKALPEVTRDSSARVQQRISQIAKPLLDLSSELVRAQQAALGQVFKDSRRTMQALQGLIQFSMVLMLLLLVFIATLMYRALVTPLRAQLTQSQAVIERQEKLASLGTLAAGVAHEIRNPLTAIKFRLFSLKKSLPQTFVQNEDILIINNEINRLERIVRDFLHFARPSTPTLVSVSAQSLLQEVISLLKPQLEKNGISLRLDPAGGGWVKADPQQMQQVFINLIQNAAESMDQRGPITLRATPGVARLNRRATPVVTFEVSDSGKGMTPDIQKRIFDPFFSTKEGGTGLGLPIAARIVERHGGFLHFQSQLNRGTTFQVVLPQAPSHAQHPAH